MWQNEIFPAGGPAARDGAVLKAWRQVMSMLTARIPQGKIVKTTPCTVDAAGSVQSDVSEAEPSKDLCRLRFRRQQHLAKFVISYNQFANPSGGNQCRS